MEMDDLDPNITADQAMEPFTDKRKTYETVLASLCLVLIILVGLIGNIAVIAVICLFRSLRSDISNILIINLSITDLANTVLIMFSALVSLVLDRWPFGKVWCDCVCVINYCLIIVSMLTLCCISIDRYQAVMHPLSYCSRITKKRLLMAIIFAWLQGLAFGIAPSLSDWVAYDYWEAICAIQWHLHRPDTIIYVVLAFVLCFLGPGIVLVHSYVKILKEVKKLKVQVLNIDKDRKPGGQRDSLTEKSRIVWSLLVVVFAYFICTTPFSVTKLIKVFVKGTDFIPGPINLVSALLGYIASAINPLIYGIFRRDFRRAYMRLLNRLCMQKCTPFENLNTDSYSKRPVSTNFRSEFDNVTMNKTASDMGIDNDMCNDTSCNQRQHDKDLINCSPVTNTASVSQIKIIPQLSLEKPTTEVVASRLNNNEQPVVADDNHSSPSSVHCHQIHVRALTE